ncbi:MAG: rhodanese-like domain-containing protein [Myxococcota bacterium]
MRETLQRAPPPCLALSGLTPQHVIVDVRSAEEFAAGHVAGARNIPLEALPQHVGELRGRPVITVCGKGGGRSERGAAELRALGIRDVRSLCGGTVAWREAHGSATSS